LVFADDWGRHPSSCQHLIRHLLGAHEVHWVNTIGMRTPSLELDTFRRGLEKIRHWSGDNGAGSTSQAPAGLQVLNPRMWPWQDAHFGRPFNRELLRRQLLPIIRSMARPPIAITTIPVVADLVGRLPVERWVYYCVDDFSEWPGLDGANLRPMEERLVHDADILIAVSETLREKLAALGRDAFCLTHGVELDFWQSASSSAALPQLDGLPRPLVVFWGVVDQRMDIDFLRRLGDDMTEGTIVLVGPDAAPDPALDTLPRVVRLGPLAYEALPQVAGAAAVLVMPYADLPVTRAMQPLKLKEYLATGKPVVARDLPATRPWGDCLDLAGSPEAFSAAVRLRVAVGLPDRQAAARARLAQESWAAKASLFRRWIGAQAQDERRSER
jgi:glycosyltransferase involved in cell wall biosynthesis